jgi:hypothetical protein
MTMIAFAVAAVHLYIELTHKNQGAGVFVVGLVFVFQIIASAFMRPVTAANPILSSRLFGLHTGTAILGYSGFAVSAAYGMLFLLLYREIKASRFGRLYERLPSLDLLALMTIRAAAVGLAFSPSRSSPAWSGRRGRRSTSGKTRSSSSPSSSGWSTESAWRSLRLRLERPPRGHRLAGGLHHHDPVDGGGPRPLQLLPQLHLADSVLRRRVLG